MNVPFETRGAGPFTAWALPLALFFAVTVEMAPAGAIEHISAAFGADIGAAAAGSSLYALSTAVLALPLAGFAQRFDLRKATILAGAIFAVLGMATSAAPDISSYLVLRSIHGAAHGAFFPLILALAAAATPNNTGEAVARVLLGNGCALAIGIPASEALGSIDWRIPLALASCGVFASVLFAPHPAPGKPPYEVGETRGLQGGIVAIAVIFALALAGHFSYYTFLAPLATDEAVQPSLVLAVYGGAVIIATALSGHLAGKRRLRRAGIVLVAEAMFLLVAVFLPGPAVLLVTAALAGSCFGLLPTLMQSEILDRSMGNQTIASGAAVVAFNAGIAAGSAGGATLVDVSVQAPALIGAGLLALSAIALTLVHTRTTRRLKASSFADASSG